MSFDVIDWERPWLAPLRDHGVALARASDWIAEASQRAAVGGLTNAFGQPLRFIPQHSLPADIAYEAHIAASGEVPTRDNLHDFFNALAWLHFPDTKRTLNALHADALRQAATPGTRGRQRDAATLFDENAALFISSDEAQLAALHAHDWHTALPQPPARFGASAEVVLFGHALIEKLVVPYKSITAHVWTLKVSADWFALPSRQRIAQLDAQVAATIAGGFDSRDFCHLPVLGVPGWWAGQDRAFYDDAEVFRPLRKPA